MAKHFTLRAACLAALGTIIGMSSAWSAQKRADAADYPGRPIRVVIGFTPGGQPDIFSRMIGTKLTESLGQQIIVDNRPGAGGIIGTKIVADASPDGHTLLAVSASHVISPAIRKVPYDTLRNFSGISLTYNASYVLVVPPVLGVKTVPEFISLARAKPGQLNFGSAGAGSGTHFATELLKEAAKIDVVHVPYKGIADALNDTMTNRVQFFMVPLASSLALVKDGKLRALGISSAKRASVQPDIPTLAESGLPGFEWDSWGGILAPAKTPRPIVSKLNREIGRALAQPEIQQRMRALGAEPAPTTPEAFDKFIAAQLSLVSNLAKRAGITAQ